MCVVACCCLRRFVWLLRVAFICCVLNVSEPVRKSGAKAGALVKIGSAILGGGGGGKDDFAQGGGVDKSKISDALKAIASSLM